MPKYDTALFRNNIGGIHSISFRLSRFGSGYIRDERGRKRPNTSYGVYTSVRFQPKSEPLSNADAYQGCLSADGHGRWTVHPVLANGSGTRMNSIGTALTRKHGVAMLLEHRNKFAPNGKVNDSYIPPPVDPEALRQVEAKARYVQREAERVANSIQDPKRRSVAQRIVKS